MTTTNATLNGVLSADSANVTLVDSGATGTFANANVGNGKVVTIGGLSLSGSAIANYSIATTVTTANITPLAVTVTGITATNKVYDGTTTATLNTGSPTLVGVLSGDTSHVTLATSSAFGQFASANVANSITVTVEALFLTGTASGNYIVTAPTTAANITPLGLTVAGVTASNKVYDSTTTATVSTANASLVGIVGIDAGNVTIGGTAVGVFGNANVANGITVTISGITLAGSAAGNYTVTQPTTSANITPLNLTVTGITVPDKTYNGHTAATLNVSGATLVGVKSADTSNVSLVSSAATATFAIKTVGVNIGVTVLGLTLGGSAAADYTLTEPSLTGNIDPRTLTVSPSPTPIRSMTAPPPPRSTPMARPLRRPGFRYRQCHAQHRQRRRNLADANVGTGKTVTISGLTLTGDAAGNYTLSVTSPTANITALPITVSGVTAANKTYDGTTTATLTTGGDSLVGVLSGDTSNVTLNSGSAVGLRLRQRRHRNHGQRHRPDHRRLRRRQLHADSADHHRQHHPGDSDRHRHHREQQGRRRHERGNPGPRQRHSGWRPQRRHLQRNARHQRGDRNLASITAGDGITVTISGLTLTGSAAANYVLTQPTTTADIT